MTSREERKKSEAINTVAGLLRERLPKPEGERAAEFARLYYGGVGPEDLLPSAVEDLYGAAVQDRRAAVDLDPAGYKAASRGAGRPRI